MDIEIRRVRSDDVAVYRDTRTIAVHDTPLAFGETPASQLAKTLEQWQARVDLLATHPTEAMFLAFDRGAAVAMMGAYYEEEDDDWVLISAWTAPTHRGTGLTATLHQAVIDWAARAGGKEIFLEVVADNERAIGFYTRVGYLPTGVTGSHSLYPDQSEIEMKLSLA